MDTTDFLGHEKISKILLKLAPPVMFFISGNGGNHKCSGINILPSICKENGLHNIQH